jgi:putative transposase
MRKASAEPMCVTGHPKLFAALDSYASRKHLKVKARLSNHPRYRLRFTPTYSSWLTQVERWLGIISQGAIRRGFFGRVKELIQEIDQIVSACCDSGEPFVWQATAEDDRRF